MAGWQLDKLAAEPKRGAAEESDSGSDDEDVPFACLICRKPYTDPVVTRCGHYFCSACAIKRFARTPKCAACGGPTGGIFNRADKVLAKLKKVQDADGAAADEDGGGGGGDDDGPQIEGLAQGSGSEDEDTGKVLKSAKDKRFDELEATVRQIENAQKINDWAVISDRRSALSKPAGWRGTRPC